MAKKKQNQRRNHKGSIFSNPETKAKEKEKELLKGPPSRVRSGAFCLKSSLGVPFLVVSNTQLVADVPEPSAEDWKELSELASCIVRQWEDRGSAVLADFEGEFMGFGGELLTAAFQRTLSVDTRTMRAISGHGVTKEMGLLLNVRCTEAAALTRRLMEGDRCLKLIWGAEDDVASVYCTLKAHVKRVVDAQLGFSSVSKRLAMAQMLRNLSPASLAGLPSKTCIDFSTKHAYNRRAFHQPLLLDEARYAVDDLHRLEAVLRSQKPHNNSYFQAEAQTNTVNATVLDNPAVFFANKLQYYTDAFRRKKGLQRQLAAVQAKRHLLGGRGIVSEECLTAHKDVEAEMDAALQGARVCVPDDLSFCAPAEDSSSEDDEAADANELTGGSTAGQDKAPSGVTKRAGERSGNSRPQKRANLGFDVWREDDTHVYDLWGFAKERPNETVVVNSGQGEEKDEAEESKEARTEQGTAAAPAQGGGTAKEEEEQEQRQQQGPCGAAEGGLGALGTAMEEVMKQKASAEAPTTAQEKDIEKENSAGKEEEGQGASSAAAGGGELAVERGTAAAAAAPIAKEKDAGKEEEQQREEQQKEEEQKQEKRKEKEQKEEEQKEEEEEDEAAPAYASAGGLGEEEVAAAAPAERTKKAKKVKKKKAAPAAEAAQTKPRRRAKRRRDEGAGEAESETGVGQPVEDAAVADAAAAAPAVATPSVDVAEACSVEATAAAAAEAAADAATPAQPPGAGKRKKRKKATAAAGGQ